MPNPNDPDYLDGTRCWIDATEFTALWKCDLCHRVDLHLTAEQAEDGARQHHRIGHRGYVIPPPLPKHCSIEGCSHLARRNGLCNSHSLAAWRLARRTDRQEMTS